MLNVRVNVLSTESHLIGTATTHVRMDAGRGYIPWNTLRVNVIEEGYIRGAIGIVDELQMTFHLPTENIEGKLHAGDTITLVLSGPIFTITDTRQQQDIGLI